MAAIAAGSASLTANYVKRSSNADNTTPKSLSSFQATVNSKQNKNISIKDAASQVKKIYGTAISETVIEQDSSIEVLS